MIFYIIHASTFGRPYLCSHVKQIRSNVFVLTSERTSANIYLLLMFERTLLHSNVFVLRSNVNILTLFYVRMYK